MRGGLAIKEIKVTLTGERQEFICQLLDRSDAHAVLLYSLRQARHVADLALPRGTVTYAYYWTDRPYNVYHWVAPDGRTLGYYINLSDQIIIRRGEVKWRDLAVDLLCSADGSRVQLLDERELDRLPSELRAQIDSARSHVLRHRDEILTEVAAATQHLRMRRIPPRRKRNRPVDREQPT